MLKLNDVEITTFSALHDCHFAHKVFSTPRKQACLGCNTKVNYVFRIYVDKSYLRIFGRSLLLGKFDEDLGQGGLTDRVVLNTQFLALEFK